MLLLTAERVIVPVDLRLRGWVLEPISPLPAVKLIDWALISNIELRLVVIAPSVAMRLSAVDGRIIDEVILISPVV